MYNEYSLLESYKKNLRLFFVKGEMQRNTKNWTEYSLAWKYIDIRRWKSLTENALKNQTTQHGQRKEVKDFGPWKGMDNNSIDMFVYMNKNFQWSERKISLTNLGNWSKPGLFVLIIFFVLLRKFIRTS